MDEYHYISVVKTMHSKLKSHQWQAHAHT